MNKINITTHDKAKNKDIVTGYVTGPIYHRKVNNKHYMVKEHGYGIQKDVLRKLASMGVRWILIKAKTKSYKSALGTWLGMGRTKDYGHGEQVFLDVDLMEELLPDEDMD